MGNRVIDIELTGFSETNKHILADMELPMMGANSFTQSGLLDEIDTHIVEHGIGIGCLLDSNGTVLGIGGFNYLADTGVYEVVCNMLPQHQEKINDALDFLVHEAFDKLRMDKICARALPGSVMNSSLKAGNFVYAGERAFFSEGREQIWNYYELEDEAGMMESESVYALADSDWDKVF